jgi:hypothetical protein
MKDNEADVQNYYTTCIHPNYFSVAYQEATFTLAILHAVRPSACRLT